MKPLRKVLFVSTILPQSCASAAGVRTVGLVNSLRQYDWAVDFFSHARERKDRSDQLQANLYHCETNSDSFFDILAESKPSVVIYDRFLAEEQFSWRVRKFDPNILQVVDTQDLHFLRQGRERLVAQRGDDISIAESKDISIPLTDELFLREMTSLTRSDLVFVCSSFEQDLLVRKYGVSKNKVKLVSFFYQIDPNLVISPGYRKHFLMLGGFRHRPNRDSIHWMKRMWGKIKERAPEAEIHVFGAYPAMEDIALTDKNLGFIVKGEIKPEDLYRKISKYRALLAPLRFGAGIKGKILDAWSVGTPVVTTAIGGEGLCEAPSEWGGRIADTESSFIDSAMTLYSDPVEWSNCAKKGHGILKEKFDAQTNARLLNEILLVATEAKLNGEKDELSLREHLFQYNSWKHHELFSRLVQLREQKSRARD